MTGRLAHLFGLRGKVALVTGGGRGIGRMIAQAFVDAGARRVYIASRNGDALERAAAEIAPDGRCIALVADLSSESGCHDLRSALAARESSLDILVNNSGASWMAPLETYPEHAWDRLFQLNLKGAFFLVRALLPLLEAAAGAGHPARIINVGSVAGEMADAMDCYAYGLSKGALHQLSLMLAKDLAERGILVNAIAPGRFETRMTKAIRDDPERYAGEAARIPAGRWGQEDDVAGVAVLLASRAGAYMTGTVIPIDGGTLLAS